MASYFRYEMGYVALPGQVEIKESGGVRSYMCARARARCMCMYAKFIREMKDLRSRECNWMNGVQADIPCALQLLTVVQYTSLDDIHIHAHTHTARGCILFRYGTYNFLRVQRKEKQDSILHFSTFAYLIKTER